jgi:hypothetical protein
MKPAKPETPEQWETLILSFIGSLCLADHMGDVSNEIDTVLKVLGHDHGWDDFEELMTWLGKRGVTTLNGSPLLLDEVDFPDAEDEA